MGKRVDLRAAFKATLVRVVTETGPRKRNVLDGLAGGDRSILDELVAEGKIVVIGVKRGAVYGPRREEVREPDTKGLVMNRGRAFGVL